MNSLKIEKTKNDMIWDKFLLSSINKNFFCHSVFLNNLKTPLTKFFVKNNEEIIAAFILNENNKYIELCNETIYTPLIFKEYKNRPISSINTEKFNIINFFKDFILKNYDKIDFISDLNLKDLRPFFYYNFEKNKNYFKIANIKYTSIINIKNLENKDKFNNFYNNLSVRVRQQYNLSMNSGKYKFYENLNKKIFFEIINLTFQRQNKKPDFSLEERFNILEQSNKLGLVKMFCVENKNSIKSFSIFSSIKNHSMYLHGGRVGDSKNDHSLTYNILKSFFALSKEGICTVDLEGINSPKRAFNKLGYGGEINPYYHLRKTLR